MSTLGCAWCLSLVVLTIAALVWDEWAGRER